MFRKNRSLFTMILVPITLLVFHFVTASTSINIKIDQYKGTNISKYKAELENFKCTTINCGKGILGLVCNWNCTKNEDGSSVEERNGNAFNSNREGIEIKDKGNIRKVEIMNIKVVNRIPKIIKVGGGFKNITTPNSISRSNRTKRDWNYGRGGYRGYGGYSQKIGGYRGHEGYYQRMPEGNIYYNRKELRNNQFREFNKEKYRVPQKIGKYTGRISNEEHANGKGNFRDGIGKGGAGIFQSLGIKFCEENDSSEFCTSQDDKRIIIKIKSRHNEGGSIKRNYPNIEKIPQVSNDEESFHENKTMAKINDNIVNDDLLKNKDNKDCKCKENQESNEQIMEKEIIPPQPENHSHQEGCVSHEDREGKGAENTTVDKTTFNARLVAPEKLEKSTTVAETVVSATVSANERHH